MGPLPELLPPPIPGDRTASHAVDSAPDVQVATVMFATSPAERAALQAQLGSGWAIVDSRVVDRVDAVLMPPCSEQTTRAVRALFPDARLIVIDSTDDGCEARWGPVERALAAGADLYSCRTSPAAA